MILQLNLPEFLFCENPIKKNEVINDLTQWIYCTKYLTLIRVIAFEDMIVRYDDEIPQKIFKYQDEEFLLVLEQNNIEMINEHNDISILQGEAIKMKPETLLHQAWEFYKKYLEWEDSL